MAMTLFTDPFFPEFERSLENTFDRAFGRQLAPFRNEGVGRGIGALAQAMHAFDVVELKDKFQLVADAPGMTPDEVKVELNEGVLTITGSHKEATRQEDPQTRMLRSERREYQFSRTFTLPDNANPEKITADLDKGVLSVSIAKMPEPPRPEPKRIAVSAAKV